MTEIAVNEKKRDHVCPYQFAFILDNWVRRMIQNPKQIVGEYIKAGSTVLDLGCGPGYFSIDMAEMVGSGGKVIAADLQPQMLEKVRKKAERKGIGERMVYHRCQSDRIGLMQRVDFILAFYMIHETGNPDAIMREIREILNPGGQMLVVEPRMHVGRELFDAFAESVCAIGFTILDRPENKGGRSMLLGIRGT